MLVVDGEEVHRVCAWPALVAALHEAHRGPRPLIGRCALEASLRGVTQTYFNLPAFLPGIAMGTKIATVLPDNVRRHAGMPAVQGVYVLFDGDDGSPSAIIDGTALTYRKTAADSALGSRLLSRCGRARAAPGGCRRPRALPCARASGGSPIPGRSPGLEPLGPSRRDRGERAPRGPGSAPRPSPSWNRPSAPPTSYAAARPPPSRCSGCVAASRQPSRSGRRLHARDARVRRRRRGARPPVRRRGRPQHRRLRRPHRPHSPRRDRTRQGRGRSIRATAAPTTGSTGDLTTSLSTRTGAVDISTCFIALFIRDQLGRPAKS